MKNGNNNVKIVAVSLPKGLLKKADERAYALFQSRSEYLKNLILSDLKGGRAKTKERRVNEIND